MSVISLCEPDRPTAVAPESSRRWPPLVRYNCILNVWSGMKDFVQEIFLYLLQQDYLDHFSWKNSLSFKDYEESVWRSGQYHALLVGFIECFMTTFLHTQYWLNWDDEVGFKEKPEDTRYTKILHQIETRRTGSVCKLTNRNGLDSQLYAIIGNWGTWGEWAGTSLPAWFITHMIIYFLRFIIFIHFDKKIIFIGAIVRNICVHLERADAVKYGNPDCTLLDRYVVFSQRRYWSNSYVVFSCVWHKRTPILIRSSFYMFCKNDHISLW